MIVKKQPYNNERGYVFPDQKKKRKVRENAKLIHKFDIKADEVGVQSTTCKTLVTVFKTSTTK